MKRRIISLRLAHRPIGFVLAFAVMFVQMASPRVQAQADPRSANDNPIIQKYRQLIPQLMAEQNVPGLAVAVVDDARVLWVEGFGFTDDDHKVPITPSTIFSVQSISKNFTAAAVLLAVQDGLLDLDAPITTYVPDFTVHSIFEEHPERKITLRMLLSHTAGFTHESPIGNNMDLGPVAFEDHIKSISDTWLRFPVGTGYAYSNLGISLAGYILQKVSGVPFEKYVEEKLLDPIGMLDSSFDMEQIRVNPNRAIGHSWPFPKVQLDVPLVPEGGLYTSASDMAKYIQFHLNRGSVHGQALLDPTLLDEMYTVPTPAQGSREGYALGVERHTWNKNRSVILFAHGGGGFGFQARVWWAPELKIGIAVLTNSADHSLLGDLELRILDDFVHDPTSIYYSRLQALPSRSAMADRDLRWRPPLGLAQQIEQHALQASDQDGPGRAEYIGAYGTRTWGVLAPLIPYVRVSVLGSRLYIQEGDENKALRLTEVSPGLFFAENGEALDFRGAVPTWRNFKLIKVDAGPSPWQWVLLVLCGGVFLSGLFFPLRRWIRRLRVSASSAATTSPGAIWVSIFVLLTSLFGLMSLGMILALPFIIYSGFLGWLELPLWQRLILHAPFALLIAGVGFLVLNVLARKKATWSIGEKIYYLVLGLASAAMLMLLAYWRLIGLSLG